MAETTITVTSTCGTCKQSYTTTVVVKDGQTGTITASHAGCPGPQEK